MNHTTRPCKNVDDGWAQLYLQTHGRGTAVAGSRSLFAAVTQEVARMRAEGRETGGRKTKRQPPPFPRRAQWRVVSYPHTKRMFWIILRLNSAEYSCCCRTTTPIYLLVLCVRLTHDRSSRSSSWWGCSRSAPR